MSKFNMFRRMKFLTMSEFVAWSCLRSPPWRAWTEWILRWVTLRFRNPSKLKDIVFGDFPSIYKYLGTHQVHIESRTELIEMPIGNYLGAVISEIINFRTSSFTKRPFVQRGISQKNSIPKHSELAFTYIWIKSSLLDQKCYDNTVFRW